MAENSLRATKIPFKNLHLLLYLFKKNFISIKVSYLKRFFFPIDLFMVKSVPLFPDKNDEEIIRLSTFY